MTASCGPFRRLRSLKLKTDDSSSAVARACARRSMTVNGGYRGTAVAHKSSCPGSCLPAVEMSPASANQSTASSSSMQSQPMQDHVHHLQTPGHQLSHLPQTRHQRPMVQIRLPSASIPLETQKPRCASCRAMSPPMLKQASQRSSGGCSKVLGTRTARSQQSSAHRRPLERLPTGNPRRLCGQLNQKCMPSRLLPTAVKSLHHQYRHHRQYTRQLHHHHHCHSHTVQSKHQIQLQLPQQLSNNLQTAMDLCHHRPRTSRCMRHQ